MPELAAIAPISRNIGIADKSQLAAKTNGVSLSALNATLKLRRYQKPKNATDPIAIPMGTRSAISTSMAPRLTSASVSASMPPPPGPQRRTAPATSEMTRRTRWTTMRKPDTGNIQRLGHTGMYMVPAIHTSPVRVCRSAARNVW